MPVINDRFRFKRRFRISAVLVAMVLVLSSAGVPPWAWTTTPEDLDLPDPGTRIERSEPFVPVVLKGLTLQPEDPLKFDFIVDSGNADPDPQQLQAETERLIKYFLASLTVPKDDLWVNLSPDQSDLIIPEELSKTEMGRDLLFQDYVLKQLSASLMYPESELGKRFWDKIYKIAREKYGTSSIPVQTFHRIWIMPDRASVHESEQTVFITGGSLKVLMEEDYLSMQRGEHITPSRESGSSHEQAADATRLYKEIILPEIEKEVNEGKHFATLRQIYHSLILAKWYKDTVKETLLAQVYVDQNKVSGIDLEDDSARQRVYDKYLEACHRGVFNYIKEDYDTLAQKAIPRKYFSGGFKDRDLTLARVPAEGALVGEGFRVGLSMRPQGEISSPVSHEGVKPPLGFTSFADYESRRGEVRDRILRGQMSTSQVLDLIYSIVNPAVLPFPSDKIMADPQEYLMIHQFGTEEKVAKNMKERHFMLQVGPLLKNPRRKGEIEKYLSYAQAIVDAMVQDPRFVRELEDKRSQAAVYELWRIFLGKDFDPHHEDKMRLNEFAFTQFDGVERMIEETPDPLLTALVAAAKGNLIDVGVKEVQEADQAQEALAGILKNIVNIEKAVYHEEELIRLKALLTSGQVRRVLLITDNSGEILIDFVLVKKLAALGHRIVIALRDAPVVNDMAMKDKAYLESIIEKKIPGALSAGRVRFISGGSQTIGVDLNYASPDFVTAWEQSDLVISKGEGNWDSLRYNRVTKPVLFLLLAKNPRKIMEMPNIEKNSPYIKLVEANSFVDLNKVDESALKARGAQRIEEVLALIQKNLAGDGSVAGTEKPSSSPAVHDEVGGIDLNEIQLERQGTGIGLRFDPAVMPEDLGVRIEGFSPVILPITPLPGAWPVLGQKD